MATLMSPIENLQSALVYLQMAEADFAALEMMNASADVQYFVSVIHHNLGNISERDKAAQQHSSLEAERARMETVAFDDQVDAVWRLVSDIGVALASR
jgi:anaphase-promoting complex subunit 5